MNPLKISISKIRNMIFRPVINYRLHSYLNEEGKFDYQKYKKIQTDGNKKKLGAVWVLEENINFLSEYIIKIGLRPNFGICHGTRRGNEQKWFNKYLNCEVIGTEISDTAANFENTIQWDFHDVKEEWINKVDFIYSNSFDHSYNPELCLNSWMSCLRTKGVCIIEHTNLHDPYHTNEMDPFGATFEIMPYLIVTWGKGKYFLREIIEAPVKRDNTLLMKYFVIQKLA